MYTIVGIERKKGVYDGREYDNTILHTTFEKDGKATVEGLCTQSFKVKTNICPAVVLGDCVDFMYDRYGNVVHVSVVS
ncbi:MAG: hypothetical protein E7637_01825 [Ruminococcaceae bacterium]|nr:hypothetical protein [Oscillospiraceae bacterium]